MPAGRDDVARNLRTIRSSIDRACERASRDPASVRLVAAAKHQSVETIRWVVEAGVTSVGENYARELRDVHDEVPGATWHFIGALQTNSAHHVAALADVVETVSDGRAVDRRARRAAASGRTLDALIEVDFTGQRAGVAPGAVAALADRVARLEGLHLRGLMTIAPLEGSGERARPWFGRLRALRDLVRENHPDVVDLSMGMSLDYEAAIEEGATMVRIGTALFGPRDGGAAPRGR
jgi:PLP dependent protein